MTPGPATDLSAEPAPSREAEFDAGGHQHLRPGVLGLGQLAATNISALVYFRRVARGSVKHFLLLGVLPAVATASMLILMIGYTRQQNGTTLAVIGGLLVLTLAFIGQARLRGASAMTSVRESAAAYDHPYQHRSLHHEHDALHPAHPEAPDTSTGSKGAA